MDEYVRYALEQEGNRIRSNLEREIAEAKLKKESDAYTPRYQRAVRGADTILSLISSFISEHSWEAAHHELMLNFFQSNIELMPVPPEQDAYTKAMLARAHLEAMLPKTLGIKPGDIA